MNKNIRKFKMIRYKESTRMGTTAEFRLFNYQNLGSIRTLLDESESPWICLNDVCRILNLGSPKSVSMKIDKPWIATVKIEHSDNQEELTFVYEAGISDILFFSRKAKIINFRRWLFKEVLPELDKNRIERIKLFEKLRKENEKLREKLNSIDE